MDILSGLNKMGERFKKYNDQAITEKIAQFAIEHPTEKIITKKGVAIQVTRKVNISDKVEYEAHVQDVEDRVAWMYVGSVAGGRLQITNANVYVVGGVDYRRMGIATALYDLIETDLQRAGGEILEPQFGSMSSDAREFWKKRRPEYADNIEKLNKIGYPASGLFD